MLSLETLYQPSGGIVAPQRENLYPASELTVHDSYQTDQPPFSHATYRLHPREPSAAQPLHGDRLTWKHAPRRRSIRNKFDSTWLPFESVTCAREAPSV